MQKSNSPNYLVWLNRLAVSNISEPISEKIANFPTGNISGPGVTPSPPACPRHPCILHTRNKSHLPLQRPRRQIDKRRSFVVRPQSHRFFFVGFHRLDRSSAASLIRLTLSRRVLRLKNIFVRRQVGAVDLD